jgi:ribosome-interacting GTPase 1
MTSENTIKILQKPANAKPSSKIEDLIEKLMKNEHYKPSKLALVKIDGFSDKVHELLKNSPEIFFHLDVIKPKDAFGYDMLFIPTKRPLRLKKFFGKLKAKVIAILSPSEDVINLSRDMCVFNTNGKLAA